MQKGTHLEFPCLDCKGPVGFSLFKLEKMPKLQCSACCREYLFDDPVLFDQIQKFEVLCKEIRNAESILGDIEIGVRIGQQEVQIPYKLLLTRFSSHLKLKLNNQEVHLSFREEPCRLGVS